jgi:hypothetical protein
MSRSYSIFVLGMILVVIAVINSGWLLLLLWPGTDFLILGVAHFKNASGIFGKRPDGTIPFWSWFVFLPLFLYTNFIWRIACVLSREPAQDTTTNDLVVGRRLLPEEVDGEFANYIDLTAEFPEPSTIRRSQAYQCFPILDGAAPRVEDLHNVIAGLRPGRTFIHCAQGHGRTGLFTLAVLLKRGLASNPDEGLEKLRASRPGIRLNSVQRQCIEKFAKDLKSASLTPVQPRIYGARNSQHACPP